MLLIEIHIKLVLVHEHRVELSNLFLNFFFFGFLVYFTICIDNLHMYYVPY